MVYALTTFHIYVYHAPVTIITDHSALKYMLTTKELLRSYRQQRWKLKLQDVQLTVQYRRGKENVVPDALSRYPVPGSQAALPGTVSAVHTQPPGPQPIVPRDVLDLLKDQA